MILILKEWRCGYKANLCCARLEWILLFKRSLGCKRLENPCCLPAVLLWLLDMWAKCRWATRQAPFDCRPIAPEKEMSWATKSTTERKEIQFTVLCIRDANKFINKMQGRRKHLTCVIDLMTSFSRFCCWGVCSDSLLSCETQKKQKIKIPHNSSQGDTDNYGIIGHHIITSFSFTFSPGPSTK